MRKEIAWEFSEEFNNGSRGEKDKYERNFCRYVFKSERNKIPIFILEEF